jgi:hypothetical protein
MPLTYAFAWRRVRKRSTRQCRRRSLATSAYGRRRFRLLATTYECISPASLNAPSASELAQLY